MKQSTEASKTALSEIERLERIQLAQLKTTYWPEEIRVADTESNIRGRIKGMFRVYCEQRSQGKFDAQLLAKIQHQFFLYGVRRPRFFTRSILSFEDLQHAVAALSRPKRERPVSEDSAPLPSCAISAAQLSGSDAVENGECPFDL